MTILSTPEKSLVKSDGVNSVCGGLHYHTQFCEKDMSYLPNSWTDGYYTM